MKYFVFRVHWLSLGINALLTKFWRWIFFLKCFVTMHRRRGFKFEPPTPSWKIKNRETYKLSMMNYQARFWIQLPLETPHLHIENSLDPRVTLVILLLEYILLLYQGNDYLLISLWKKLKKIFTKIFVLNFLVKNHAFHKIIRFENLSWYCQKGCMYLF